MPNRPSKISDTKQSTSKNVSPLLSKSTQHGSIFKIPPESLTHVCCYLDPVALYNLSRTCKRLNLHIADHNTWRRAFAFQLLGIKPEHDIEGVNAILLRRSESSWKKEFIKLFLMKRRWARSPNTTITHYPHRHGSTVDGIHFMPSQIVLSASMTRGLIARSHLLRGSVIRGFFNANTNPGNNRQVTSCAMTSDGSLAKVGWGFEQGAVSTTVAPKAVELTAPTSARTFESAVPDWHDGIVVDSTWDGREVVTVGTDGQAKVWSCDKATACTWTSNRIPHALVKVASSLRRGIVAAAAGNGEVVVWTGVGMKKRGVTTTIIPCPSTEREPAIRSIHANDVGDNALICVSFLDEPLFHLFQGKASNTTFTHLALGQPSFGLITSLQPFLAKATGESSFIFAGDSLGYVNLYTIDQSTPIRRLEAFETGDPVTATAWNAVVLVVGSSSGQTKVFDGYTFEPLRTFNAPAQRSLRGLWPVNEILLSADKDTMAVRCGEAVMGWFAGPVPLRGKGGVRGRHTVGVPSKKTGKTGNEKYREKIEFKQSIHESKAVLEFERQKVQAQAKRRVAQDSTLDALGLSEAEAVDYLLMLSREEEEARLLEQGPSTLAVEDDGMGVPGSSRSQPFPSISRSGPHSFPPLAETLPFSTDLEEFPSISPPKASISSSARSAGKALKKSKKRSPPRSSSLVKGKQPLKSPPSPTTEPHSIPSSPVSIARGASDSDDEDLRLAIQLSLQEI